MASMSWSMLRRIVLPPRSSMTPSEANEQDISPGRYCGPRPVPPAHVCPSVDPGPVPLADGTDLQNLMGRGVNLLAQEDNALAGHTGAQHTSDKCGRRMKDASCLSHEERRRRAVRSRAPQWPPAGHAKFQGRPPALFTVPIQPRIIARHRRDSPAWRWDITHAKAVRSARPTSSAVLRVSAEAAALICTAFPVLSKLLTRWFCARFRPPFTSALRVASDKGRHQPFLHVLRFLPHDVGRNGAPLQGMQWAARYGQQCHSCERILDVGCHIEEKPTHSFPLRA